MEEDRFPVGEAKVVVEAEAYKPDDSGQGPDDKPGLPIPMAQPLVKIGDVIRRWVVKERIGAGAFGETFRSLELGSDGNSIQGSDVCLKIEKFDAKKMVLRLEVLALKKVQACPYVVRYISSGRQDDINFLVMEHLGENLAELRKRTPSGCFDLFTSLHLGICCLDAIEGIHKLGLIHRDIKPSNFVLGRGERSRRAFLIDFGLARRYRGANGEIKEARPNAGFRGTTRYASINSHKMMELCRRDDLWSLFYMLVECYSGSLPWRRIKDKDAIGRLKEETTNASLVRHLPREFNTFLEHLLQLGYEDEPDYAMLRTIMQRAITRHGYNSNYPLEWERAEEESFTSATEGERPEDKDVEEGSAKQFPPTPPAIVSPPRGPPTPPRRTAAPLAPDNPQNYSPPEPSIEPPVRSEVRASTHQVAPPDSQFSSVLYGADRGTESGKDTQGVDEPKAAVYDPRRSLEDSTPPEEDDPKPEKTSKCNCSLM